MIVQEIPSALMLNEARLRSATEVGCASRMDWILV
jgi:hypothetical protein